MNGKLNLRLTEELFDRPVLMSIATAMAEAPLVGLALWFGIEEHLTVTTYLIDYVLILLAFTFGSLIGVRLARKKLPAGVSPQDMAEVRRITWLGLPVSRPELAPGVYAYAQASLNQRTDIVLLVLGLLLLALGGIQALRPEMDDETIRSLIMFGVLTVTTFAAIPYLRRIRKMLERARANAEEVLGANRVPPPAHGSAQRDAV